MNSAARASCFATLSTTDMRPLSLLHSRLLSVKVLDSGNMISLGFGKRHTSSLVLSIHSIPSSKSQLESSQLTRFPFVSMLMQYIQLILFVHFWLKFLLSWTYLHVVHFMSSSSPNDLSHMLKSVTILPGLLQSLRSLIHRIRKTLSNNSFGTLSSARFLSTKFMLRNCPF